MKTNLIIILFLGLIYPGFAGNNIIEEHGELTGPFATPQEVTKACIECHEEEADDFYHSRHYRWEGKELELHGKKIKLGKNNLLNNFCIGIGSNEPRCTSCHTGYGYKDKNFNFNEKSNMDCLICHDQTGTYKKFPTKAGYPVFKEDSLLFKPKKKWFKKIDLLKIAQNVGKSTNKNCGTCHFFGGGGHAVKQGDLDNSLINATADIDVHMGNPDPEKRLTCSGCHINKTKHVIQGALHASMTAGANHMSCDGAGCHDQEEIHEESLLNTHTEKIACETCHIPRIAKKYPTKTYWDWSTAGDKKKEVKKDEFNQPLYSWKKGDFVWNKNFRPEYYWYNGKTDYYLVGEKIEDPGKTFVFNKLEGDKDSEGALISPFKVMRGKQFIDKKQNILLIPHLFGKGGYWSTLDWNKAFKDGMEYAGLTYSGEFGVIETEMFWPIDHMVAPKEEALKCTDCHAEEGNKSILNWKALGYPNDPTM